MTLQRLGKAARRLAGHFSRRDEDELDGSFLPHLMGSFARAADIMAQENRFLQDNDVSAAAALLPEKTATMEELTALVARARKHDVRVENLSPAFRQVQRRFTEIAAQNGELLQRALVTQEAVMKLLIESAVEANRHGYGRTGEVGSDTSCGSLSLNDRA
ncbi:MULTISPECIES: hypothetical protein [Acetobacteraceae]|uniref:hypothetical protein n=1 Tax=Acetobacteraceae TaxID=433 RepID=UPI00117BA9CF|nr:MULTISPECIES: hypothetical protein [Acetobacteraceae]MCQ0040911.1 hypothetical protein [Bombella sp.]MCT6813868.1 hypothetical protein [Bombella apis]MCT6819419.1 hypothetical protein [Bombella apis]